MGCGSKRQADGKPARTSKIELPSGGLWKVIIPLPLAVRDWISSQATDLVLAENVLAMPCVRVDWWKTFPGLLAPGWF